MGDMLDTVLLLALPASGKSEIRKYLAGLSPEVCRNDFFMGSTVQLDDFPYVHFMRCIDDTLASFGRDRIFFLSSQRPFRDPKDWGTLIQLVNEDYDDLLAKRQFQPRSVASLFFDRIDAAGNKVGILPRLALLPEDIRLALADRLEAEARKMLEDKLSNYPEDLKGKTLMVEFARGGAEGSSMPLPSPFGYRYSLAQLSPKLLQHASILYIWVTPEESRRKNDDRADPNDPGSILHHGVPIEVMLKDYGTDDMDWLQQTSPNPDTIMVEAHGKIFYLPVARFDNRVDKTSFIRKNSAEWLPKEVEAVHQGLRSAMHKLSEWSGKRRPRASYHSPNLRSTAC